MVKYFATLILFTTVLFSGELKSFTDLDLALKEARAQNKKLMMFFHAEYCHYCTKMKNTTLKDDTVIDFLNSEYVFLSIDEDDNPDKDRYILTYLPAMYILDSASQKIKYHTYGYRTPGDFIGELKQNVK